ncbi:MAG TPA: FAD-containing oxidoreductase [Usitatibacter sp.]|jgi:pyruvate/2-oxoglutarate dehydrogenase complex dihydrolipoamide dehydrogenase (E3) component|nr:FAD-containing oxidoreductase [Usitatibacter sp.]
MAERYDSLVIGAGQAGPSLAVRLAKAGRRTALIERGELGGTCVNTGCTPTKALVASARAAYIAGRAADFGVTLAAKPGFDLARAMARKDEIVGESRRGLEKWLTGTDGLTLIRGHARFEGAHAVRVGDRLLEAREIFLDVGARANVPRLKGVDSVAYLTNASILELRTLPRHLVVVGGSYVGLEFAQMFRRFGSEVTVVEMGRRLVAHEDEDVSDAIRAILEDEGIRVRLSAECIRLAPHGDGVTVGMHCDEEPREVHGSHVLLAVGRRPNTDDLGLEHAGVKLDERGHIVVDDELRTNVEGIWALGEVNGRGAFTHTSYNDYEIVAANLLDGGSRRVTDRIMAYAMYIDPPLGRAGLSEHEVRASKRPALVGRMPMSGVARARERGETKGFMKVLVDKESRRFLGASLLGIEADEVIHTILDLMYADAPYTVMRDAVHIHPTVAELVPTLLGQLEPLEGSP